MRDAATLPTGARCWRRRVVALLVGLGLALCVTLPLVPGPAVAVAVAVAQPSPQPQAESLGNHYAPTNQQWNGLSAFQSLVHGLGLELVTTDNLDWEELSASDILLVIYPQQAFDPVALGAFVQAGGHAIIADDFGDATHAMSRLGIIRQQSVGIGASRYYENRSFAPIATASGSHPIAQDVGDIITNHPSALSSVEDASVVAKFDRDALVVAGERGTGRFVVVADPSIFINRMLEFPGNLRLAANMLRWLSRNGRAARVVLARGDFTEVGQPAAFIDDSNASGVTKSVARLNRQLDQASTWLLVPGAMRAIAVVAGLLLLLLLWYALPYATKQHLDGAWLRMLRPTPRDEAHALIAQAQTASEPHVVSAAILRDRVQAIMATAIGKPEPLFSIAEARLPELIAAAHGPDAALAYRQVAARLRAIPTRGQAASAWNTAQLSKREFDTLYQDCDRLCRSLGQPLSAL